jgi:hypothetical protein
VVSAVSIGGPRVALGGWLARTQEATRSSAGRAEDSRMTRARPSPARLGAERAASPRRRHHGPLESIDTCGRSHLSSTGRDQDATRRPGLRRRAPWSQAVSATGPPSSQLASTTRALSGRTPHASRPRPRRAPAKCGATPRMSCAGRDGAGLRDGLGDRAGTNSRPGENLSFRAICGRKLMVALPRRQRTRPRRFCCLAAAITLNHQAGRPTRALVNRCA